MLLLVVYIVTKLTQFSCLIFVTVLLYPKSYPLFLYAMFAADPYSVRGCIGFGQMTQVLMFECTEVFLINGLCYSFSVVDSFRLHPLECAFPQQ